MGKRFGQSETGRKVTSDKSLRGCVIVSRFHHGSLAKQGFGCIWCKNMFQLSEGLKRSTWQTQETYHFAPVPRTEQLPICHHSNNRDNAVYYVEPFLTGRSFVEIPSVCHILTSLSNITDVLLETAIPLGTHPLMPATDAPPNYKMAQSRVETKAYIP